MKILNPDFYNRSPLVVAKELLGKVLVRKLNNKIISGRIVEVEAYLGIEDEASHSYKGITKRNASLFKSGGHAYVHPIHMQNCIDVVTEGPNFPSSVLIRALEPIEGIETMRQFRNKEKLTDLTSGPGKLTKALNIDSSIDGLDMTNNKSQIFIIDDGFNTFEVVETNRIGISKARDLKYRFYIKDSKYISKK